MLSNDTSYINETGCLILSRIAKVVGISVASVYNVLKEDESV